MTIQLNHTIVHARDSRASAAFLATILGLGVGADFGRFVPVAVANGVTLDYMTATDPQPQHYAFLLDDEEFDAAFARIQERGWTTTPSPAATDTARSTRGGAVAGSTSTIPTVTPWRSSRGCRQASRHRAIVAPERR